LLIIVFWEINYILLLVVFETYEIRLVTIIKVFLFLRKVIVCISHSLIKHVFSIRAILLWSLCVSDENSHLIKRLIMQTYLLLILAEWQPSVFCNMYRLGRHPHTNYATLYFSLTLKNLELQRKTIYLPYVNCHGRGIVPEDHPIIHFSKYCL